MITTKNYFEEIETIGVSNLPETFRKSHDFLVKSTVNGKTWDTYQNNGTIQKVIDLYLNKLNQFLGSKSGTNPKIKSEIKQVSTLVRTKKPHVKVKSKPKEKIPASKKTGKKVEHIREEVKFIKRYVGLHNKVKSPHSILTLIKSLQRSILQKLIRKTSPLAKEIQMIQDKLVNVYNTAKGDLKIEIGDKDLAKLVRIAGGEEVYPSINIMKRYVGMQGKEADQKKLFLFIKQIENALDKKKVSGDDPYYEKVKAIHNTIKKLKAGQVVNIGKAELNGLEGIVKACGCKSPLGKIYATGGRKLRACNKRTYSDSKSKGACSHKGLSGVLTAEEMASRKFETLNFNHQYRTLLGSPAKNFTLMLHGEPGAGKTTFLLMFSKYLAENFGEVLYISSEEYAASTMTDKINELLNPFPERLHFAENLEQANLSEYDFVILDSVNDLGLNLQSFKDLRKANPHVAFILILQHTKDGQYRGGKDWEHAVEIAGKVENGVIEIYRNRYGVKGTMNFFDNYSNPNTYQKNYTLKPY